MCLVLFVLCVVVGFAFGSAGGCGLWCLRLLLILLDCFCCGVCGYFVVCYVVFVADSFCYAFSWRPGLCSRWV